MAQRVYLVSWWFADFGGMERHITELARSLKARGAEVTVFTEIPTPFRNQYRRELRQAGISFVAPPIPRALILAGQKILSSGGPARPSGSSAVNQAMGGSLMARLLRWTLEGRLRRETPDVVHVHGWRLRQWVVPWCALRGIPTVYTEHSNIGDWGGPDLPSAAEFLNCAGDVACVSESACEGLSEWLPGRSLAIHRHIVRLPERAATAANAETRLISVARLRAEKGLDVLIEAAARLRARGLRFRLELLGDGPQRGELAALGRRLGMDGCVVLSGSMGADAVNEKMASADVFVLPSRTEAMPLALLEAMAHGLAIVASRVGGIPEVIREGESGLLAPAGSVEALAEALARVIADAGLRQRLAASARRQAESGPYSEAAATASVLASYSKARSARASR